MHDRPNWCLSCDYVQDIEEGVVVARSHITCLLGGMIKAREPWNAQEGVN